MRDGGAPWGRTTGLRLVSAAVAVAVSMLAGCSVLGGGDEPTGASSQQTAVTTTTPAVPDTPTTSATTPAVPDTPTSPATTPAPTKTRWPKALGEPQQGDPVWGVYLAVAHSSSDPSLLTAQQQVAPFGYSAVVGDVACDDGALKALGLNQHDYWTAATLYFKTKTDATDFANSYLSKGGTVIGTAKVGIGCLD